NVSGIRDGINPLPDNVFLNLQTPSSYPSREFRIRVDIYAANWNYSTTTFNSFSQNVPILASGAGTTISINFIFFGTTPVVVPIEVNKFWNAIQFHDQITLAIYTFPFGVSFRIFFFLCHFQILITSKQTTK